MSEKSDLQAALRREEDKLVRQQATVRATQALIEVIRDKIAKLK